jgi:hypothetical protein
MAMFKVRRVVGDATDDDMNAAALRSIWCLSDYPGVHWVNSLWDRDAGELICLYEAHSADEIRSHAVAARLPCDDVREITVIDPDEYIHG